MKWGAAAWPERSTPAGLVRARADIAGEGIRNADEGPLHNHPWHCLVDRTILETGSQGAVVRIEETYMGVVSAVVVVVVVALHLRRRPRPRRPPPPFRLILLQAALPKPRRQT